MATDLKGASPGGKNHNTLVEIPQYGCTHQSLHLMCLPKEPRVIIAAYWVGCLKRGLSDGSHQMKM